MSPVLTGGSFNTEPPGNPLNPLPNYNLCEQGKTCDSRQLTQTYDLYCYKNVHLVSGYTETIVFLESLKDELASMYK